MTLTRQLARTAAPHVDTGRPVTHQLNTGSKYIHSERERERERERGRDRDLETDSDRRSATHQIDRAFTRSSKRPALARVF